MKKGKLIVIEGTDCSGKETQSKRLIDRLNQEGMKTEYFSFPKYDSPTGKIVGLSYLGKPYLAEELINDHIGTVLEKINIKGKSIDEKVLVQIVIDELKKELGVGWFKEGAPKVDPKVSSLYYAADRKYNMPILMEKVENGTNIILDRYIYSNMGHQGGKIGSFEERKNMYEWIAKMEFEMLGLPEPDIKLFLHMPTHYATFLRQGRTEALDEHENDINHLLDAERAYIEVANMFGFDTIKCVKSDEEEPKRENIKTPEVISREVYNTVKKQLILK